MDKIKDKEILQKLNKDHSFDEGFSLLVREYQEKLYWQIRRIVHSHADADDVLQNTFVKVFKNIKGYRGESGLYTWLYRIATNESISFVKTRKRKLKIESPEAFLENTLQADQYFDSKHVTVILKKAIELLPEKQKMIFNLRYYDEMPYKQMSELLDTSIGALKASFHHAVNKVEQYLKDNYDYANG